MTETTSYVKQFALCITPSNFEHNLLPLSLSLSISFSLFLSLSLSPLSLPRFISLFCIKECERKSVRYEMEEKVCMNSFGTMWCDGHTHTHTHTHHVSWRYSAHTLSLSLSLSLTDWVMCKFICNGSHHFDDFSLKFLFRWSCKYAHF